MIPSITLALLASVAFTPVFESDEPRTRQDTIDINLIRPNPISLRTVNKQSESYQGLVNSIREKGFLSSVSVRESKDESTGETYYELIDGLHRYTAAMEAGITKLPSVIALDMDDREVLEAQLMQNVHKVETKPAEYSEQLRRILDRNPYMTEAELAKNLGVSVTFIRDRLNLNKITSKNIRELIDTGKIVLANAFALAKLPEEEQENYITEAMTETADQFVPKVLRRKKDIDDAIRQGRKTAPREFAPVAFMHRPKELQDTAYVEQTAAELQKQGAISDIESFKMGVLFTLHLDPISIAKQKAEADAKEKAREEAKLRAKSETQKKRAEATALDAKKAEFEAALTDRILKHEITTEEASGIREKFYKENGIKTPEEEAAEREAKKKQAAPAATS